MSDVVKRSLWLLAISSGIVVLALALGQPRGATHGAAHEGAAMTCFRV